MTTATTDRQQQKRGGACRPVAAARFVHGLGIVVAVGLVNVLRAWTVAVVAGGGAVGAQVVRCGRNRHAGGAPLPLRCADRVDCAAADACGMSRRRRRCSQRRSVDGRRGGAVGRLCKNDA